MKRLIVDELPSDPLGASCLFHQNWFDPIERALMAGTDVTVVLEPADHTHEEWRRAVAAMLARKHTPRRINLVAGEGAALEAVEDYLANSPGITGQYLRVAS